MFTACVSYHFYVDVTSFAGLCVYDEQSVENELELQVIIVYHFISSFPFLKHDNIARAHCVKDTHNINLHASSAICYHVTSRVIFNSVQLKCISAALHNCALLQNEKKNNIYKQWRQWRLARLVIREIKT